MEESNWIDKGLAEGFRGDGESVIEAIERRIGRRSRVHLHNPEEDTTTIVRLTQEADPDSRYKILGEIARGGVGVVYRGHDGDLGRDVALKVLRRDHSENADVARRFIEEAQIGGQLQHPGIVPVYGLGLLPDGRPSFAMKLVKGGTLAAHIKERPEERRFLLNVYEQVCDAVSYAHAHGVIHRDLKPSNVMLGAFGEVLVVDWGFAKVLGTGDAPVEHTVIATVRSDTEGSQSIAGSVMGTPAYMPPEQALGHVAELDERSDVFALGAILCEILTGKQIYEGGSKDQLVQASQGKVGPALERLDQCGADAELIELAKRCLSPLPKDRPENAAVLAETMGAHLAGLDQRARQAEVDAEKAKAKAGQQKQRLREAASAPSGSAARAASSSGSPRSSASRC